MDDVQLAGLQALIEPILSEGGMELVELTSHPHGRQHVLRLLVDNVGGMTIQQCAKVNRLISQALDAAQLMEGSYVLEVSSPGLDRPLMTKRDFERALGETLRLELKLEDGRSKELQGILLAVQQEAVVLQMSAGNVTVSFTDIRSARKWVRW